MTKPKYGDLSERCNTVLFDMDGVLINSEQLSKKIWVEVAMNMGVDYSTISDLFNICLGMSRVDEMETITKRLGWTVEHCEEYFRRVQEQKKLFIPLRDGVLYTLQVLREKNYTLGVVSSSTLENIQKRLKDTEIDSYFSFIVSGDSVKHSKPDPEIYEKALRDNNLNKDCCIVLEDSPNGAISALGAGITVGFVEDTIECPEELKEQVYNLNHDMLNLLHLLKEV